MNPYEAWEPWDYGTEITSGPSRIYDSDAAEEPMPPTHPFGFTTNHPAPRHRRTT